MDELGPLEMQIMTLQKQISESVEQCGRLQQFWLRQQQELVRQTQEAQQQRASVDELKRKHTILEQKKLRMNGTCEEFDYLFLIYEIIERISSTTNYV